MSFLPLDDDHMKAEMVLQAERELGETPIVKKKAIGEFRMLIRNEPSLTCITDDSFLLMFLRYRKFDVKKSMDTLKRFYVLKNDNRDIIVDFDLELAEKLIQKKVFNVLPYRDHDGCPILAIGADKIDFEEIDFSSILTTLMLFIFLLSDSIPASQICGLKVIDSLKTIQMRHLKYATPRHIFLVAKAVMGAVPFHIKAVYLIDGSSVIRWLWNAVKFVLSKKLRERVHFCTVTDMKEFFDPAILPEDFGGTLKYDTEFFTEILKANENRLNQINNGSYG